jgi:hypothetical protein
MNEVYFFCEKCRVYRNAGYRHAVLSLCECGLIDESLLSRDEPYTSIDGEGVLRCRAYWTQERATGELADRLRGARTFLQEHQSHALSFGDIHRILRPGEQWYEWLSEDGDEDPLPRYLAERLHLRTWSEVETYVASRRLPPWWWQDEGSETRIQAREAFEEAARAAGDRGGGV